VVHLTVPSIYESDTEVGNMLNNQI